MSGPVLEILSPGPGITVQDAGRPGWKRFGLPPGGAMDRESAARANRLVGNQAGAQVLEMLFAGARFRALRPVMLGFASVKQSRGFSLAAGERIDFGQAHGGVWSYLAIGGGFVSERWFDSASVNARAGLGRPLRAGDRLAGAVFDAGIALASSAGEEDLFAGEVAIWKGPEWDLLGPGIQRAFLETAWTVSPQSDRTGYRLTAENPPSHAQTMASAPMAAGVVQWPAGGQPIVLLRDGPTVGGYPRLAIIDEAALSRFTQCAPGTQLRFRLPA